MLEPKATRSSTRLSYLAVQNFWIVVETSRKRPKTIGIGVCRFVGAAPGILGLASSGLTAESGPSSTILGRILYSLPGLFRSAGSRAGPRSDQTFIYVQPDWGPSQPDLGSPQSNL